MAGAKQLDRRTALTGIGVSMSLPWLECMHAGETMANATRLPVVEPRRMCCIMFPYGIAVPADDHPERTWGWFPQGNGTNYQLTQVLSPLADLMDNVTVIGGLSHPNCRQMNGHDTGDTFLTGNNLEEVTYRNTVSLDQYAARTMGQQTRLPSLTLSTDGGIGPRTRSTTLSYSDEGQPIPALSDPRQIFNRMFGQDQASRAERSRMESSPSILDLVLEQSRSLRSKVGTADARKLDEYESSVRDVEGRIRRSRRWLEVPLPEIDANTLTLDVDPDSAEDYIGAMYDLMFLAFQTDLTRLCTYQIGSYGPTVARTFPAAIGLPPNWHSLAHGAKKAGGAEQIGRFDQFLIRQLARFLTRLNNSREGADESRLLDRTLVLYGSSNSQTHVNSNYPLLLAGGKPMGIRHNQYLKFNSQTPMSNLFVSMLRALDIDVTQFADSTGPLADLTTSVG